jgi:hypothetical protein
VATSLWRPAAGHRRCALSLWILCALWSCSNCSKSQGRVGRPIRYACFPVLLTTLTASAITIHDMYTTTTCILSSRNKNNMKRTIMLRRCVCTRPTRVRRLSNLRQKRHGTGAPRAAAEGKRAGRAQQPRPSSSHISSDLSLSGKNKTERGERWSERWWLPSVSVCACVRRCVLPRAAAAAAASLPQLKDGDDIVLHRGVLGH